MQLLRGILLSSVLAWSAQAQQEFLGGGFQSRFGRKTHVRLVLSHEVAKPGDTVIAGVELKMDPGWHTYWQNPGESGDATKINWTLPPGITAGEIQWPLPEKLIDPELGVTTYVFHSRAVLLVPLQTAADAASGPRELSAKVSWVECEKACVLGNATVSGKLTIGDAPRFSSDTNLIAEAQKNIPSKQLPGAASANWEPPDSTNTRPLVIEWATDAASPDFYPITAGPVKFKGKTDVFSSAGGKVTLRKSGELSEGEWPQQIVGLLVRKEGEALRGYEVSLPIGEMRRGAAATSSTLSVPGQKKPLWLWLAYAFLGGLILNIMPCVLPVIALKILGFVSQSREDPRRIHTLGLLYTLGIVTSFLVLAGMVIAVKAAGHKAGWGMQFSNPQFIVAITVLVTLVALNLFGVFEIALGGRTMGAVGGAASRHGNAGAFMNGVLATILATPCTAPFLGAALGFAFAQPPHIIALFFVTIALGLASPYLVLSWNPKWLKLLPKPGAWMERFKIAMGFPMLATAVWLFTLTDVHYGDRILWLGVFLVIVGLSAWIYGEFVQRGRARRGVSTLIALLLLVGGFVYAVENKLRWREPLNDDQSIARASRDVAGAIQWQRWSRDAVANARAAGHPVLVDFTAKWCLTCNTIVKPVLESSSVRAKLAEVNAVPLLADYTKYPPEIGEELERFGRAGVPLVLVFPKDPVKPAIVLPETPTIGMVVKALEEAGK